MKWLALNSTYLKPGQGSYEGSYFTLKPQELPAINSLNHWSKRRLQLPVKEMPFLVLGCSCRGNTYLLCALQETCTCSSAISSSQHLCLFFWRSQISTFLLLRHYYLGFQEYFMLSHYYCNMVNCHNQIIENMYLKPGK